MLRHVLKIVILCILLGEPLSHGMISPRRKLRRPRIEMALKRAHYYQRHPIHNFAHTRFLKRHQNHPRRSKRSYQDMYAAWDSADDDASSYGNGWGGEESYQPMAQPLQVQDVYLQSVNNYHDPNQQQQIIHQQQPQPQGPPPQGPPVQNQGNFNGGQAGHGPGSQQHFGSGGIQQGSHHFGNNAAINPSHGYQQPPPHQGGPVGPNMPYQQQHNEPSNNNGGFNNHGRDSYNWDSNNQKKDAYSDYEGGSYQDMYAAQNEETTPKGEYYLDPRWDAHMPNKGDRSHEQKHWLRGDPNAKSPGYKPTLPPVLIGRKTYWDFKDEDDRALQRVHDNANERARKNPHSYAPVPHGKLMTHERRRQEYNHHVPTFRRREDMERSGELAYVPRNHYVKPLQYVDKNFKFMEINPKKPKWGSQSKPESKKQVQDDPTPFIEWAKFGSDSTTLFPSRNSHYLSLLIYILLQYFIL